MSKRNERKTTLPAGTSGRERKPGTVKAASLQHATPKKSPPKTIPKTARNKGLRFPEVHAALGEALRAHRKQRDVSQSDISLDVDIDRAYISRIERAEQSPTVATLLAIATGLGIPAWQLLKEAEETAKTKNA